MLTPNRVREDDSQSACDDRYTLAVDAERAGAGPAAFDATAPNAIGAYRRMS